MLHHFKKEDQAKASEYLHCMRYCALQMIRNMELGEISKADSFKRDMNMYYSEIERMAKNKQEIDKVANLIKHLDKQMKVDRMKVGIHYENC